MGQRRSPKTANGALAEQSVGRTDGPTDMDGLPDLAELGAEPIGRYLSRQRRLRGISIDELAELTRIPVRSIERLEAGHFDHDADGFVRGFVRTVADGLGLDPQDTLSRMLGEPSAERERSLYRSPQVPRALVGLAVVLLLGLAFGLVQSVVVRDEPVGPLQDPSVLVWRSDPIRNLADAHAAQGGDRLSEHGAAHSKVQPGEISAGGETPPAGPPSQEAVVAPPKQPAGVTVLKAERF